MTIAIPFDTPQNRVEFIKYCLDVIPDTIGDTDAAASIERLLTTDLYPRFVREYRQSSANQIPLLNLEKLGGIHN